MGARVGTSSFDVEKNGIDAQLGWLTKNKDILKIETKRLRA